MTYNKTKEANPEKTHHMFRKKEKFENKSARTTCIQQTDRGFDETVNKNKEVKEELPQKNKEYNY